jgi:hypothetical protein
VQIRPSRGIDGFMKLVVGHKPGAVRVDSMFDGTI